MTIAVVFYRYSGFLHQ